MIQMIKSGRTATFGELAKHYFNTFTSPLSTHKCYCVHVVFDQYLDDSIKAGERARRGSLSALEVYNIGPATPVSKQWDKYMSNPNNKKNLCDFLTHSMCNLGQRHLRESTQLVIGGRCKDGERCVAITRDSCVDVEDLKSNQEEADTRMLLHAKYAAGQCQEAKIVIQSPDTDVLVLSAAPFEDIASKKLWFRTGVKDRLPFVPVHDVCQNLSNRVLKVLPAFHALTGRDTTSPLSGIGKKKPWNVFIRSAVHQESLTILGQQPEVDEETAKKCEAFICDLYPSYKKSPKTADELRYIIFCQKDRLRFVPVHDVCQNLSNRVLKVLPAFHALTGRDTTSALSGIGKKKPWNVFIRSAVHQESLTILGQQPEVDEETAKKCEAFICDLYPSYKKSPKTADELRYIIFCQKKLNSEALPPTSDSLRQHINRPNYQTHIWRKSLNALLELPSPKGRGWQKDDELKPKLMSKDPAPTSLLELTTCTCTKKECSSNCSCANVGLSCTEACTCMAEDTCKYPHGVEWELEESDSNDEE